MRVSLYVAIAAAAGLCAALDQVRAQSRYAPEKSGVVTEVRYLTEHIPGCGSPTNVKGKIVSREFQPDGVRPSRLVFEKINGERLIVNIFVPINMASVDLSYVLPALQKAIRVGRTAQATIKNCSETSHEFLFLEAVK